MINMMNMPEDMLRNGLESGNSPCDFLYPEERPDKINMLESDDYDDAEEESEEEAEEEAPSKAKKKK